MREEGGVREEVRSEGGGEEGVREVRRDSGLRCQCSDHCATKFRDQLI